MKKLFPLFTALCLALAGQAQFTVMKVDGVKGESTRSRFKDWIDIDGLVLDVSVPTASSGGASGRRTHQPLVILKNTDGSSPTLFNLLVQNRRIREITIEYYKTGPGAAGLEVLDYSITLKDVTVTGFKQFMGPVKSEPFNPSNNTQLFDEIKLTYQSITIKDASARTEAEDNIRQR